MRVFVFVIVSIVSVTAGAQVNARFYANHTVEANMKQMNRPLMSRVPSGDCNGHQIQWGSELRNNLGRYFSSGTVYDAEPGLHAIQVGDGRRCSVPLVLRPTPHAAWSVSLSRPVRVKALLVWTTGHDADIANAIVATSKTVEGRWLASAPQGVRRYTLEGSRLNVITPTPNGTDDIVRHLHIYRPGNNKPIRIQSVEIVGDYIDGSEVPRYVPPED